MREKIEEIEGRSNRIEQDQADMGKRLKKIEDSAVFKELEKIALKRMN